MPTEEEYKEALKVVAEYEKERNIQRVIKRYGANYANLKKTDCKIVPGMIYGDTPVKFVWFSTELDGVENEAYDAYIREEDIRFKTLYSVGGMSTFKQTEAQAIEAIYKSAKNKIKSILEKGL